jgi:hypothetical protein
MELRYKMNGTTCSIKTNIKTMTNTNGTMV